MQEIAIHTADGTCRSFVLRPTSPGPWPAVIVYMDGIGIRPAMLALASRIARHGDYVLLPDLFYRSGTYEPMDAMTVFADPDKRKALTERFLSRVTPAGAMSDTRAFLDYLDAQPDVVHGKVGTTGYCMGGRLSLIAAGTFGERITAAASFHGGRLANDDAESPHRLASGIRAQVYVAGAIEDPTFPDDMKARLEDALTAAGVRHVIETYPAKHGFALSDTPSYDRKAEERHFAALFTLLDGAMRT